jgi:tetratricopeptide (TPR) repeat protein
MRDWPIYVRISITTPVLAFVCRFACLGSASAAAFIPVDDNFLLERLPARSTAIARELRDRSADARANPSKAIQMAQEFVKLGREESDPRYYGYAEGLLASWSNTREPPPLVSLLRALIKQSRHDFDGALAELDRALAAQPSNSQAWLTRAAILKLQGRFEEARASCLPLAQSKDSLLVVTCVCEIASLDASPRDSLRMLESYAQEHGSRSPELRQWSLTIMAEIAARLGDVERADAYFQEAINATKATAYLLSAYSDFLLDEKRAESVVSLLANKKHIDSALLRLALAQQRLKGEGVGDLAALIEERFAATRRRGEKFHLGDEARFTLYILHDPAKALRLAKENWSVQRTPSDARILYDAAFIAGDADSAKRAADFLERTGLGRERLSRMSADAWNAR